MNMRRKIAQCALCNEPKMTYKLILSTWEEVTVCEECIIKAVTFEMRARL